MPYIPENRRNEIQHGRPPFSEGELNYAFTALITDYLQCYGLNYANLNLCIGALECAKLELYRRMAAPYEDTKCAESGDVYPAVDFNRGHAR